MWVYHYVWLFGGTCTSTCTQNKGAAGVAQSWGSASARCNMSPYAMDSTTCQRWRRRHMASQSMGWHSTQLSYVHLLTSAQSHSLVVTSHRGMKKVFSLDRKTPTRIVLQHTRLYPVEYRFNLKLYLLVYRCLHNLASPLIMQYICCACRRNPHCC